MFTGSPPSRRRKSGLQVDGLEPRAFACREAQSVAEIGFEIAVIGVDHLEGGGEERGFDRRQRLPDFLGKIGADSGVAPIEAVGQQIIL